MAYLFFFIAILYATVGFGGGSSYIALLVPQAAPLLIVRLLRILRIFRVLRLLTLLNEANELAVALRNSGRKIFVFFTMMMIITTIFGCLLYVIEGPERGFTSIPGSIYWAIVTITTVGYGDMVPATPLGRAISSVGMLIGYAVIAVPTGIVTAELTVAQQHKKVRQIRDSRNCTNCASVESDPHARYCRNCGSQLPRPGHEPEPAKPPSCSLVQFSQISTRISLNAYKQYLSSSPFLGTSIIIKPRV